MSQQNKTKLRPLILVERMNSIAASDSFIKPEPEDPSQSVCSSVLVVTTATNQGQQLLPTPPITPTKTSSKRDELDVPPYHLPFGRIRREGLGIPTAAPPRPPRSVLRQSRGSNGTFGSHPSHNSNSIGSIKEVSTIQFPSAVVAEPTKRELHPLSPFKRRLEPLAEIESNPHHKRLRTPSAPEASRLQSPFVLPPMRSVGNLRVQFTLQGKKAHPRSKLRKRSSFQRVAGFFLKVFERS